MWERANLLDSVDHNPITLLFELHMFASVLLITQILHATSRMKIEAPPKLNSVKRFTRVLSKADRPSWRPIQRLVGTGRREDKRPLWNEKSKFSTKSFHFQNRASLTCAYKSFRFKESYFVDSRWILVQKLRREGLDLHRLLAWVQHNSCCYTTIQHLMTSFCNIWWHHFEWLA